MRVLQLIDSLRSGGAERMSVTYANSLAKRIDRSFLCCTRMEGLLKEQLESEVGYLFLNKGGTLDFKAFLKLRGFVRENKVDLIQAHGTSFFMGVLLKISIPGIKLVWHDHFGERAKTNSKAGLLTAFSRSFNGIITVTPLLAEWGRQNLYCGKVQFIPNFPSPTENDTESRMLKIKEGFKIVHLANLKYPKDHITLLNAFQKLSVLNNSVSLHLIGKDEKDSYSEEVRKFLKENDLEEKVYLYGEQDRVEDFLEQADVGVLSSESEGLPVALLEYGQAGLPVVCTRVGECEGVVDGCGLLVPPKDAEAMFEALRYYVENEDERKKDSVDFHNRILELYSEEAIMKQLLSFYQEVYSKS